MKNRSISSQNVDSANIYNHGIVKAGDDGNGRRGADGRGGTDKTDGTAPTNGTKGSAGGNKGAQGEAYYYGDVYTATQTDKLTISGTLTNGTAGTAGSQGNDGWGGLNLTCYYATRNGEKGFSGEKWGEIQTIYPLNTKKANVYKQYASLQESASTFELYYKIHAGRGYDRSDYEVGYYNEHGSGAEDTGYYIWTFSDDATVWAPGPFYGDNKLHTYSNVNGVTFYYIISGEYGLYSGTSYKFKDLQIRVWSTPVDEFLSAVCQGKEINIIQ